MLRQKVPVVKRYFELTFASRASSRGRAPVKPNTMDFAGAPVRAGAALDGGDGMTGTSESPKGSAGLAEEAAGESFRAGCGEEGKSFGPASRVTASGGLGSLSSRRIV